MMYSIFVGISFFFFVSRGSNQILSRYLAKSCRYKQKNCRGNSPPGKSKDLIMGNGVSGKASANLKTIYLDVEGRKHKVTREVSIFVVLVLVVLVVFSFRVAKYCNSENLIAVKLTILILLSTIHFIM